MKKVPTNENSVNNNNQSHKKEDLYRVTYLQSNPLRGCDFDGIPLDLVCNIVSKLNGLKNIQKLRVKYLDKDELKQPTHESFRYMDNVEFKTIGELFYSDRYKGIVDKLRKDWE